MALGNNHPSGEFLRRGEREFDTLDIGIGDIDGEVGVISVLLQDPHRGQDIRSRLDSRQLKRSADVSDLRVPAH